MKYLSPLLSEASGAVAGLVASHNRGGQYFRARVTPTDPLTTRQAETRANMAALVSLWQTLTPAQRAAWDLYASNVPVTNTLGQTIHLTGQQMYIRTNTVRLQEISTTIDTAPSVFNTGNGPNSLSAFTFDGGTGDIATTFTVDGGADGGAVALLYAGRPQNLSRSFYKGPYQFARSVAVADTDTTFDIVAAVGVTWLSDYVPSLTQLMPLRCRMLYNDGRLTQAFSVLGLPVAPTT